MKFTSTVAIRLGKVVLGLAIISCSGWALAKHGQGYLDQLGQVHWSALGVGLAICCGYRLCNAHGWWLVLRALGQRLSPAKALKLWLFSEACRWLPGSVWNFGSRALLGARAGVEPVPAAASLGLELGLTLAAWLVVAGASLPLCGSEMLATVNFPSVRLENSWYAVALVCAMLIAGYVTWRALLRCGSRQAGRLADLLAGVRSARPQPVRCLVAFSYFTLMVVASGLGLACFIGLMDHGVEVPVAAIVGANVVAWLVGFFAFVAPGGLVVREGSLAVVLAIWMPLEQAFAVAVAWRLLQIGAELMCVLIVLMPAAVRKLGDLFRVIFPIAPVASSRA